MVRFRGVLSPKCPICLVYFAPPPPAVSSCCCASFFSTSLSASYLKTECELIRSQCSELISCFVSEAQLPNHSTALGLLGERVFVKKKKKQKNANTVRLSQQISLYESVIFICRCRCIVVATYPHHTLHVYQTRQGRFLRAIYFQSQHLNTLPAEPLKSYIRNR